MNRTRLIASLVYHDWRTRSSVDRFVALILDAPRRDMEKRKEQAFARALAKAAEARKAAWALNWRLFCRSLRSHPGLRFCAYHAVILLVAVAVGPNAPNLSNISMAGCTALAALAAWPLIPALITAWTMRHQHAEDGTS